MLNLWLKILQEYFHPKIKRKIRIISLPWAAKTTFLYKKKRIKLTWIKLPWNKSEKKTVGTLIANLHTSSPPPVLKGPLSMMLKWWVVLPCLKLKTLKTIPYSAEPTRLGQIRVYPLQTPRLMVCLLYRYGRTVKNNSLEITKILGKNRGPGGGCPQMGWSGGGGVLPYTCISHKGMCRSKG